jgi:hypothetical protein
MTEKEVVKMQDRESGKIIGQGKFPVYVNRLGKRGAGFFHFTISIYTKDEKYKIELSSFFHEGEGSGTVGNGGPIENEKPACGASIFSKKGTAMSKKEWIKMKNQVNDNVLSLINDLKKFMSEEDKDKW